MKIFELEERRKDVWSLPESDDDFDDCIDEIDFDMLYFPDGEYKAVEITFEIPEIKFLEKIWAWEIKGSLYIDEGGYQRLKTLLP